MDAATGLRHLRARAAGAARKAKAAIERKYATADPSTQIEATAALVKQMRMADRVAATSTADLQKTGLGMLDTPLQADRVLLAAIGGELRRRGETSDADLIGSHLRTPIHQWDDAWLEADAAEKMLTAWNERSIAAANPQLPDGSPRYLDDLLEASAREAAQEASEERGEQQSQRIRTNSRAAFDGGAGE